MSQSIEGLYPLLILIGASILKGLHKRVKEKKEQEKKIIRPAPRPPLQPKIEPEPSVSIKKIKPVKLSQVVKKEVFYRKKKPRIGKLVEGIKNKKNLILLSEILVKKQDLN
ncbi:MAG: hypothetical protein P0S93_06555 [Candidatus Neptunochlamydia sp.]|nr:hypothetical protein [Candidatus Neptunochlamydia sp.]